MFCLYIMVTLMNKIIHIKQPPGLGLGVLYAYYNYWHSIIPYSIK
jgi:hypothetical protein